MIAVTVVAVVAAWVLLAAGIRWWARSVEPRVFAPRAPLELDSRPPIRRPVAAQAPLEDGERLVLPPGPEGHVAFARDLLMGAQLYYDECEARADAEQPAGTAPPPRRRTPAGQLGGGSAG